MRRGNLLRKFAFISHTLTSNTLKHKKFLFCGSFLIRIFFIRRNKYIPLDVPIEVITNCELQLIVEVFKEFKNLRIFCEISLFREIRLITFCTIKLGPKLIIKTIRFPFLKLS